LLGETPKSLLDVLSYAEKMGWIDNSEAFISARKLRNLLVHEYMRDPSLFLEALGLADEATTSTIRTAVAETFGEDANIWLFGSRVDDNKRGGDIDLLIETK